MSTRAALAVAAAVLCLFPVPSGAQGVQLSGMVSALGSGRFDAELEPALTVRFMPEVKLPLTSGSGVTVDAEVSLNAYGSASFPSGGSSESSGDVRPYRAWLRLSTARFEARAGLQHVSFGSATLLRPMMWFDSLDPRDPLQLTDGVYALLVRYFTKSNASLSAWTMYGNDTRRGWDLAAPDKKAPEFGGRIQVPLFKGELGASYHRRKAAVEGLATIANPQASASAPPVPEERFGLDGKWDIGVGVWVESALVHQKSPLLPQPYQLAFTAGIDYTFGVGNGLTAIAEHLRFGSGSQAFSGGQSANFSALLVRYPLGLLDQLTGIFYIDWQSQSLYRFVAWRRTYDALSLNTILFWSPSDRPALLPGQQGSSSYAGVGFQFLLSYHF